MADFKTHVTFSSVLGCGYTAAALGSGVAPASAIVAGGLCGLSGMLPDIDSDSGIPRRESMSFAAAIVPMLLVDRFSQLGLGHDQMVLATAGLYFFIRFGVANLIGRFSVHRGMFHSIPAALIFAGVAFLICGAADLHMRYFKALAVFLGVMSHLVLDEVYSVDISGEKAKFKRSFGTAVKFWGKDPFANFSTYVKLAVVAVAILGEPGVMGYLETKSPEFANRLQSYRERIPTPGAAPSQPLIAVPGDDGIIPNRSDDLAPWPTATAQSKQGWPAQSPAPSQSEDRTIYDTARRIWHSVVE